MEVGPSKGDGNIWYYDEVETAPFLKQGTNIWAVIVLWYPSDTVKGNHSIFQTDVPGLFIESVETDKVTGVPVLKTNKTWKTKRASSIKIVSESSFFAPLQIYEDVHMSEDFQGWMDVGYRSSEWENAQEYLNHLPYLKERTIPFMNRIPRRFQGISKIISYSENKKNWELFLKGDCKIEIPAHSKVCIEFDAGELMTGYLKLKVEKGTGARVELLQSEAYIISPPEDNTGFPIKIDRTDSVQGMLWGYTDRWQVCGNGISS